MLGKIYSHIDLAPSKPLLNAQADCLNSSAYYRPAFNEDEMHILLEETAAVSRINRLAVAGDVT